MGAIGVTLAVALLGGRTNESAGAFRSVWLPIAGGYLFPVLAGGWGWSRNAPTLRF